MQFDNTELYKVVRRYVPDAGKLIDTTIDHDTGAAKIHVKVKEITAVMPQLLEAIEVIANFTGRPVIVLFNPTLAQP